MNGRLLPGMFAVLFAVPALPAAEAIFRIEAIARDGTYSATGTVEAVRGGTLSAQVSGRVVEVMVRSGEAVRAGQILLRIEADDAVDAATAGAATASGAAARLGAARSEFERAQRLRSQDYISVAALQRSEAALRSAEAEAQAAGAAASAARTRAGWRTVIAPYAGTVTQVLVAAGDLATPGRPLVALYSPGSLRVIAQVPESLAPGLEISKPASVVQGSGTQPIKATSWAVVNAVSAATHSVEVRAELPAGAPLQPGQFVRVLLPVKSGAAQLRIPVRAVVRRSEVTGVYVVDKSGVARLRQVRLGPTEGDEVTVLAGLQEGEQISLDPVAAGRR
jgi:RND family efflux transporter MFP subunit